MKIKIAVLDKEETYLKRLARVLESKYIDQVEMYSFTDLDTALSTLGNSKIDMFIASDEFDVNVLALPGHCAFAYFVDSDDISMYQGSAAICKFQKVEQIYKQILGVYAETAANISNARQNGSDTGIIVFSSPAGGAGASSLAAACAVYSASRQRRCLYLNLESFGSADLFFSGEGQADMSDVIFSIKSRNANLSMKLESYVKIDARGVSYYSAPKLALDMMEMTGEECGQILDELRKTGGYDDIIIDMDFSLSADIRDICRRARNIVWVSDGSELANEKIRRAYESLAICEQEKDIPLTERIYLAYNRFSNKTGVQIHGLECEVLGGARKFENRNTYQIVTELSQLDIFQKLIKD